MSASGRRTRRPPTAMPAMPSSPSALERLEAEMKRGEAVCCIGEVMLYCACPS